MSCVFLTLRIVPEQLGTDNFLLKVTPRAQIKPNLWPTRLSICNSKQSHHATTPTMSTAVHHLAEMHRQTEFTTIENCASYFEITTPSDQFFRYIPNSYYTWRLFEYSLLINNPGSETNTYSSCRAFGNIKRRSTHLPKRKKYENAGFVKQISSAASVHRHSFGSASGKPLVPHIKGSSSLQEERQEREKDYNNKVEARAWLKVFYHKFTIITH